MATNELSLRERILQFQIDEPGVELTFVQRLARENGWSQHYAGRVVDEYRRFLVLAREAGHVVTPSEQVDQAWHLHLTYTRSYWEKLCRDLLGRPLHHGPTQGGQQEQAKYKQLYAQTLASYERIFGHAPPSDIWSPVETRFGEDLQHVTVNTARYWIIPKPRWPAWRVTAPAKMPVAMFALLGLPLLAITNPFDWRGPPFLLLLIVASLVALLAAIVARQVLWPHALAESKAKPLDPYQAACLAAGRHRIVDAAVASMVHAGYLQLAEQKQGTIFKRTSTVIRPGKPLPGYAPRIERAVYEAATPFALNSVQLRSRATVDSREIEDSLIERGLVYSQEKLYTAQVVAGAIMLSPLLLAIPKLIIGIQRGKPVGFLIASCVVIPIVAIAVTLLRKYRTPAGERVLREYADQHETTRLRAQEDVNALDPAQLGMVVGIFGAGMLAGGQLDPLQRIVSHASGGGGCGTSSSGGCGGSGCGGGGGGCGGGGCGGCGGG